MVLQLFREPFVTLSNEPQQQLAGPDYGLWMPWKTWIRV